MTTLFAAWMGPATSATLRSEFLVNLTNKSLDRVRALAYSDLTMANKTRGEGGNNGQGMNWISQVSRLAIYLRDGLACVYCAQGVEQGARLTLDHCKPRSKGGTNEHSNLVTACVSCNAARCDRALAPFVRAAATFRGVDPRALAADIENKRNRNPKRDEARALIDARGSVAKVINEMRNEREGV